MSLRKQMLALVCCMLVAWAGSVVWLGMTVSRYHAGANAETLRLLRDEERLTVALEAFAEIEALRRENNAMVDWRSTTSARFAMDAAFERFWAAIKGVNATSGAEASVRAVAKVRGAALIWERDLRDAMGFGDGRLTPTPHVLDQRAATLEAELSRLFRLLLAEFNAFIDADRGKLLTLLERTLLALGLASLAAGSVALLLMNRITHRVGALETSMRKMAAGDLEVDVVDAGRPDEIGRMADALESFRRTSLEARRLAEENATVERQLIQEQADAEVLQRSLEKEREINGLQRNFVAMVSHEFRTPLAIIDGTVQRVMRMPDTEPAHGKLGRIRTAVKRLIMLIERVLSLATFEEGKIDLKPEPCDLRELLNEICSAQQEARGHQRIRLDTEALPESIEADPGQLLQVFTNLIGNAIKYSPDGGAVDVVCASEGDLIEVAIRDRGVGIPEDEIPQLFTRFFRASTSAGISGSGIGLHLVQAFVDMHGGEVRVESVAGEGSCFTVRLPVSQPAMREKDPEELGARPGEITDADAA